MIKYLTLSIILLQFTLADFSEPFHLRVMATTNISGETDPCG